MSRRLIFTLEVLNTRQMRAALRATGEDLRRRLEDEVARTAFDIEGDSKTQVPVNFARLRTAIRVRLTRDRLTADVGVFEGTKIRGQPINYAIYVHDGTRGAPRRMPPLAPLKLWAARKLGDESAAFPIALKIQREGTKATPFLAKPFEAHSPSFERRCHGAVQAALRGAGA